jgi:hypothetical protein
MFKSMLHLKLICLFCLLLVSGKIVHAQPRESWLQQQISRIFGPPPSPKKTSLSKPVGASNICFVSFHQYWYQNPKDVKEVKDANQSVSIPDINLPVLSQTPLLIWQGAVEKVVVQRKDLPFSKDLLWEQSIETGHHRAIYSGKTLKRNEQYKIRLDPQRSPGKNEEGATFNFFVLSEEIANQHQSKLDEITQKLKAQSVEVIALERSKYLADEKLFLDAIQEIASIEKPSEEFQEAISALAQEWIKKKNYLHAMSAVFLIQNPTSEKLKQLRTQLESLPCFPPESSERPQPDAAKPQ